MFLVIQHLVLLGKGVIKNGVCVSLPVAVLESSYLVLLISFVLNINIFLFENDFSLTFRYFTCSLLCGICACLPRFINATYRTPINSTHIDRTCVLQRISVMYIGCTAYHASNYTRDEYEYRVRQPTVLEPLMNNINSQHAYPLKREGKDKADKLISTAQRGAASITSFFRSVMCAISKQ